MNLFAELALLASLITPLPRDPLLDRERFPSRELALSAMTFNREYQRHLQTRMRIESEYKWEWYREAIEENNSLFHIWDWLHAAQGGEGREETYWRHSMGQLRELIGDKAYNAGMMPPPAPTWRFEWVTPR